MIKDIEVLMGIFRPTGDIDSTECRTYKYFYDLSRFRTENYPESRFKVISSLGLQLHEVIKDIETSETVQVKNIDPIAFEFSRVRKLDNSLELIYSLIESTFKNLKRVEADYFIDPEIRGQEGVVFKLLIKDKPKKILQEEDKFYFQMKRMVPVEEHKYFSLTYQVI
jgi:hypothetical protein